MFNYSFSDTSLWLNTYCLLVYLTGLFVGTRRALVNKPLSSKEKPLYLLVLGCFLLLLVSCFFNADFFSYQRYVKEFKPTEMNYLGALDYVLLIIGKRYIIFRMVVWWGAVFIVLKTSKRLGLDKYIVVYCLFAMFLLEFCYARATLAMAVYYFGYSFLCKPIEKHKSFSIIFGIAIIISSFSFHRSMAFLIALTPLILLPLNKKTIFIALIFFPLLVGTLSSMFFTVLNTQAIEDELIMGKIEGYSDRDYSQELNIKGLIMTWLNYISIYAIVLVGLKHVVFSKKRLIPKEYVNLVKISAGVLFLATLFLFLDIPNTIFYYRILYMSMIPATLFFCFLYRNRIITRWVFYTILFARIGYHLVRMSYYVTSYM